MSADRIAKTVKVGALRIDLKHYSDGRIGFDYKPPGENRIKVRLHKVEDAEQRALEILGAARGGHIDRMSISEEEFAEFMQWKATRQRQIEVPKLLPSFMDLQRRKGVSPLTIRELESTLKKFCTAFPRSIAQVERAEVVEWLDARGVSPRRWNNMRAAITALWRYARREGYLPAVLTGVETMEKRRVSFSVQTYNHTEIMRLLAVVEKGWLPLIVLGAFCGLRPEEIHPNTRFKGYKPALRWENLNWERRVVDVPAAVAKDRRRRFAPLTETAADLLSDWRKATGDVVPSISSARARERWTRESGIIWKPDALRHSFASYRLALTKDLPALCLEMGNSPTMIHRHYLDLKHYDESRDWFAIRKSTVPKVPLPPLPEGFYPHR